MTKQQLSPEFLDNELGRVKTLQRAFIGMSEAFSLHEGHQKAARLYSEESAAKLIAADEDAIDALIREERTPAHSYSPVREAEAILEATQSYSPVRETEAIIEDDFETEYKQLLQDNQLSPDEKLEIEHRQLLKAARVAVDAAHSGEDK